MENCYIYNEMHPAQIPVQTQSQERIEEPPSRTENTKSTSYINYVCPPQSNISFQEQERPFQIKLFKVPSREYDYSNHDSESELNQEFGSQQQPCLTMIDRIKSDSQLQQKILPGCTNFAKMLSEQQMLIVEQVREKQAKLLS